MDEDIKWTMRVFKAGIQPNFHWVITRTTENSKYQKDGEEPSESMALSAALSDISEYELKKQGD